MTESNSDISLTEPESSDPPYSSVVVSLHPDHQSTIVGLANLAEQLLAVNPSKAKQLRDEVNRMIRELITWECL